MRTPIFLLALWITISLGPERASSQQPSPSLVEEIRFGEIDGSDALTEVGGVLVRGDTLFVSQPRERIVRRFLLEGRQLEPLGRRGQGPGEFERIDAMGLIADSLLVVDRANRRITAFSVSGEFLTTWRLPEPPSEYPLLYRGFAFPSAQRRVVIWGDAPVAAELDRVPIVLADSRGLLKDTLSSYQWCVQTVCVRRDNGGSTFRRPLHDHPRQVVSGDGSYFVEAGGDESRILVSWVDLTSGQRDSLRLPANPVSVSASYRDSIVQTYVGALERVGNSFRLREIRQLLDLPEVLFGPDAIMVGPAGRVWLRNPRVDEATAETWLRVERGGQPTRVYAPSGVELLGEGAGLVWGVVKDDFGVSYLVGFRLVD